MTSLVDRNLSMEARFRRFDMYMDLKVHPTAAFYTCEDVLGNLPDEISGEKAGSRLPQLQPAEIEPEEFESVYLWFFS